MNSGTGSNLQRVLEALAGRGVVVWIKAQIGPISNSIRPDWNDMVNLGAGLRGRKRIGLTIMGRIVDSRRWVREYIR